MEEWKPDQNFLEFLLKKFEEEGHLDYPLLNANYRSYTKRDLFHEMWHGTELGKLTYESWYNCPITKHLYDKHKSRSE